MQSVTTKEFLGFFLLLDLFCFIVYGTEITTNHPREKWALFS